LTSGSVLVCGESPLENDAVLGRMNFVKESQIYPDIKVKRALEAPGKEVAMSAMSV
jgi:hypothetical protein